MLSVHSEAAITRGEKGVSLRSVGSASTGLSFSKSICEQTSAEAFTLHFTSSSGVPVP